MLPAHPRQREMRVTPDALYRQRDRSPFGGRSACPIVAPLQASSAGNASVTRTSTAAGTCIVVASWPATVLIGPRAASINNSAFHAIAAAAAVRRGTLAFAGYAAPATTATSGTLHQPTAQVSVAIAAATRIVKASGALTALAPT